jgi:aromatic-L-amino-acid decarboxylase
VSEHPLEPEEAELRRMVEVATERVLAHLRALPTQKAAVLEGGEALARSLKAPMPEQGGSLEDALEVVFDRALEVTFNTAHAGYLAYIPGGGVFPSAVADLISNAINRYVGVWIAAPGLAQLEQNVVRFFADTLGFGPRAGGFLTTGGSLANLSAVITARRVKLGDDFTTGVLYCSAQTHHSVIKSAYLAGLRADQVREVPTDEQLRMDPAALRSLTRDDRAAGKRPFCVVASAGTTNTGAVDPLPALADLCEAEDLWLHTDAAYGGFFRLTERGRAALAGIERSDTVTLDPHKGLFLPLGNGSLLAKDVETLRAAHSVWADYLPGKPPADDLFDFSEISPELSRDFRGLRAWLPLQLFGVAAFRAALDEKLDLTAYAHDTLAARDDIEIVAAPQLSVFAFRVRGDDDLNQRVLDRVNARGRVYLTPTRIDGRFVIRVCVLHFRTHKEHVDYALEDLDDAIRAEAA